MPCWRHFCSGKTIDKLFLLDGCMDGPIRTIQREAKKHDTIISYVTKERLDQISETGKHQGVIAYAAPTPMPVSMICYKRQRMPAKIRF